VYSDGLNMTVCTVSGCGFGDQVSIPVRVGDFTNRCILSRGKRAAE